MKKRYKARLIIAFCLLAANLSLLYLSKSHKVFTDNVLVPLGYYVLLPVKMLVNLLPFSLSEIALVFLIPVAILFSLILIFAKLIKRRKIKISAYLSGVALWLSVFYFLYNLALGYPAYRTDIKTTAGWKESSSPSQTIVSLAKYLANKANTERSNIAQWKSYAQYNRSLMAAYQKAGKNYAFANYLPSVPKRILLSVPLSYTQTAGIFIPFFAEANINTDMPVYCYPFTAAHEMAHSVLVTNEADANLAAFLACIGSDDGQLRYSACFFGLLYTFNALAIDNQEELNRIYSCLSGQVKEDYKEYSENVRKYEGKVAELSEKINDTYLKATGQPDGVKSYGKVADLLILWYANNYS